MIEFIIKVTLRNKLKEKKRKLPYSPSVILDTVIRLNTIHDKFLIMTNWLEYNLGSLPRWAWLQIFEYSVLPERLLLNQVCKTFQQWIKEKDLLHIQIVFVCETSRDCESYEHCRLYVYFQDLIPTIITYDINFLIYDEFLKIIDKDTLLRPKIDMLIINGVNISHKEGFEAIGSLNIIILSLIEVESIPHNLDIICSKIHNLRCLSIGLCSIHFPMNFKDTHLEKIIFRDATCTNTYMPHCLKQLDLDNIMTCKLPFSDQIYATIDLAECKRVNIR
jgi:hypothetical protein